MRSAVFGALMLTMSVMALAHRAHAQGTLAIRPARPTTADTVIVVTGDDFPSRCWAVGATDCATIVPDTLLVTTAIDFCDGASELCMCNDFPWMFLRYRAVGRLPAGTYVAKYVELHTNPIDPIRTFTRTLSFTVEDATPALRRTWGRLKSTYR
jgi:hypothetical protein